MNLPPVSQIEQKDVVLVRYVPAFQGVVVAHENLQFLDSKATLKADCPFANCHIAFDATVWSPQVGMKLGGVSHCPLCTNRTKCLLITVGKISLCSPDHVSLLVHRTFNVSIPRHHLPADQWEFEYSSAENDPESRSEPAEGADEAPAEEKEHGVESGGRWINKGTAVKLGGPAGFLQFTVVGYATLVTDVNYNTLTKRTQINGRESNAIADRVHPIEPVFSTTPDIGWDGTPCSPACTACRTFSASGYGSASRRRWRIK